MTEDEVIAVVKGIAPVIRDYVTRVHGDLLLRVTIAETQLAAIVERTHDVGPLRERVVMLETRPQLPGPAGKDGDPGPPGKDGADGTPGLAFRGVFIEGQCYEVGHLATWAGSTWHCNEPTMSKPGDGSKAWTLMVKKGKDGRDGKDGGPGPEGPRGKDWQQVYEDTRRR